MNLNLHEIGRKHGTDKYMHVSNNISFLTRYESFFKNIQLASLNILEIGVLKGASVITWKQYFLNSNIIGIDIDPQCKSHEAERLEIFIGSQDDEKIKEEIAKKYKTLNIVLDDGSHINQLTIASFNLYWPLIASGGMYIIEDTHCVYEDLTASSKKWPGMKLNRNDIELDNRKIDYNQFLIDKIMNMSKYKIYNISIHEGSNIFIKM